MKTFAALLTFFALLEGALAQKALITFTAARHEKLAVYFGTPSVDAVAPAPPPIRCAYPHLYSPHGYFFDAATLPLPALRFKYHTSFNYHPIIIHHHP